MGEEEEDLKDLKTNFVSFTWVFFSFLGLFTGELPECTQELMIDVTKSYYQKFLPLSQIWPPTIFLNSDSLSIIISFLRWNMEGVSNDVHLIKICMFVFSLTPWTLRFIFKHYTCKCVCRRNTDCAGRPIVSLSSVRSPDHSHKVPEVERFSFVFMKAYICVDSAAWNVSSCKHTLCL